MDMKIHLLAALLMGSAASASWAQTSAALHTRSLAANCMSCHGTDGRTVAGSAVPSLAGMPKTDMVRLMNAFKDGTRPATVMHQINKGLTDEQIDRIANYFAALQR